MKNLKRTLSGASLISMLIISLFTFNSCKEETKIYEQFYVAYGDASASTQSDVANYVALRCSEINESELAQVMEKSTAESIFNNFCSKLVTEVKDKGYKVFADTWVNLQLSSKTQELVSEKKVTFTQTTDPKYYVQIILKEIAPNGQTAAATTFVESLLNGLDLTKDTKTENEIVTNTYSFYKEYTSDSEASNYYNSKEEALKNLIDKIEKEWPADVIYTGKFELTYAYVNEATNSGKRGSDSYITHMPAIVGKTWTTTAEGALFTSIKFTYNSNTLTAPYFVDYKITLDGTSQSYEVLRLGTIIGVMNADGSMKYAFQFANNTSFKLIKADGADVTDGAVYTVETAQ